MAFHEQRRHTEAREKQRGTEPDRAAAHNEDRDFNIWVTRLIHFPVTCHCAAGPRSSIAEQAARSKRSISAGVHTCLTIRPNKAGTSSGSRGTRRVAWPRRGRVWMTLW